MPVYDLNRGINKPVEFKGLVGSNIYFWWPAPGWCLPCS